MPRGCFGRPGAGADAALRLKVFLDDRIQLHMPQAPHSHTPKPSNRKHDLLWLMMKQRHEEVDRKMDKVLILAYNTFEKGQEGGATPGDMRKVKAPRRSLSSQNLVAGLQPGWGLKL